MGRVIIVSQIYIDPATSQWVSFVEKAYKYDSAGNKIKELDALGYAAGTGATTIEKINSGYGTEYTYNLANKLTSVLDPVSKDRALTYTTSYTYDALGRVLSVTNANGVITRYTYNAAGDVLTVKMQKTISDPLQTIQTNTYDYMSHLLTQTDGNGNITTYAYNKLGKLRKVIYPGDLTIPVNTVYYQYDVMDNLAKTWDTMGKQITFVYDNQGRLLSKTESGTDASDPITVSYSYDKNGNVRFATDGNGIITQYTYNAVNKVLTQIIGGHTTTQTYDANGNLLITMDWLGNTYAKVYDPLNRLIERTDPYQNTIETLVYNNNSVQISSTDALGHETSYIFDKNNRLLSTTDATDYTTSQTYDNAGNIRTKVDGNGNTATYNYDEFNWLISIVNAKDETTSYTYDLNGNVLTVTDGNNHVTTYEYNAANKSVKAIEHGGRTGTEGNYIYDLSKVQSYTYYGNGLTESKTDKNGNTTDYAYDIHGRLLSQTTGSVAISYTYDADGNQLTMTDGTGTTTRTYDDFGRVLTKAVPDFGTITYVYDITVGMNTGCIEETSTDPQGNEVEKIYDRAGRLLEVISDDMTTTYTYYDNGSIESVVYSGSGYEEYTYTVNNKLSTLTNKKADDTVIDAYSYTYDGAGNMLSKLDSKGTTSYTYDELNRLLTVTEPGGKTIAYTYDNAGNRLSETTVSGSDTTVTAYTYDAQNRLTGTLTQINGVTTQTVAYTYDNNGNELTETDTPYTGGTPGTPIPKYVNTYDVLNQLIQVTVSDGVNTTTALYTYNGDGLRVRKNISGTITDYLYEYSHPILEQDAQGVQTSFNVYGVNLISRTVGIDTLLYMYNGHADVTALIDTSGNVIATYYYDAFGNVLEATGNSDNYIMYAGYQYDKETGLYYLNARMYDPITARFMQEDTYTGKYNDPLSLNLYTYCANNPLIYSDPTGHSWWDSVKNWFSGAKETIKETVSETYNTVKTAVNNAITTVANTKTGKAIIQKAQEIKKTVVGATKSVVKFVNDNKEAIAIAGIAIASIVLGVVTLGASVAIETAMLGSGMILGGIFMGATEAGDLIQNNGKIEKSANEYLGAYAAGFTMGAMGPLGGGAGLLGSTLIGGSAAMSGNALDQYISTGKIDAKETAWAGVAGGVLSFASSAMTSLTNGGFKSFTSGVRNVLANERGSINLGGNGAGDESAGKGLNNFNYAQKTYSSNFSAEGQKIYSDLAGQPIKSVNDLTNALKNGTINPADVPVNYIVRDGNTLILNTRTGQALTQAGIPMNQWNTVNQTGNAMFENMLTNQLINNGLTSAGTSVVILK